MKILIYGLNFSPELTGIGRYVGEMARWLVKARHETAVVCAPPYYPQWRVGSGYSAFRYYRETVDGVQVLRCPLYVPHSVSTLKRLIHLFSFSASSFFGLSLRAFRQRPDLMVVVIPTLFCLPGALLVAKILKIKCVVHIQDYEIDAMQRLDMGGSNRLAKLAGDMERWLLSHFDAVSTISFSMMDMALKKGVAPSKLSFFPNWVDTAFMSPRANHMRFRTLWGIPPASQVILYSGNLGEKQGLDVIVEAARVMWNESAVCFVLVGDGSYRDVLMQQVAQAGLSNVMFRPLQPYECLPDLLAMADVHLVVQRRGAADVVLPSKLTSILSVGGYSVITADPHTELGRLCVNFPGISQLVEPENPAALVAGIRVALEQRRRLGSRNRIARAYAEKFLNGDTILRTAEQQWRALVDGIELVDCGSSGPHDRGRMI